MATETIKQTVHSYIDGVLSGEIPAGLLVKQACQRHLDDLKHASGRGIYFDEVEARVSVEFFGMLRHSKGEWSGKPFELSPWQVFLVWVLFGWKRSSDNTRRFRTAYIEVPRKNGKSTLLAGIGLRLFTIDLEGGAEIYTAATKKDQAKIVHEEACRMVKASPALSDMLEVFKSAITCEANNSKYIPISSESETQDGLNVHAAIVDELHEHKTRDLWDVLDTATSARRQPMMIAITTAGDGTRKDTICREHHDYSENVLDPNHPTEDDTWFTFIATCDKDDDWTQIETWAKANPAYGISVKPDDLARKVKRALHSPAAQNNFRRKHLNQWVGAVDSWLEQGLWSSLAGPVTITKKTPLYLGMDLASRQDLTAIVSCFCEDGMYYFESHFWIPTHTAERRAQDGDAHLRWADAGHITLTDTQSTDYRSLRHYVNELADRSTIQTIGYDPYNATHLVNELGEEDGFDMVEFRQGYLAISPAIKELERLILDRKVVYDGNPILAWNVDNVSLITDTADNVKFDKRFMSGKIDGAVAMIMAFGIAMRDADNQGDHELLVL